MAKVVDKIKNGTKKLQAKFTKHPQEVDQTYGKHLLHSWKTSFFGCWVSFQYFIHGVFPFWFKDSCECQGEESIEE